MVLFFLDIAIIFVEFEIVFRYSDFGQVSFLSEVFEFSERNILYMIHRNKKLFDFSFLSLTQTLMIKSAYLSAPTLISL
jgi:hypothetical protein